MARTPKAKAVKGVARVRGKRKTGKAKAPAAITVPTEIVTAIGLVLSWFSQNARKLKPMLGPGGGTAEECEVCDACDGVPTGQFGIPMRLADGTYGCIAGPTGAGYKYLIANENGPVWSAV